MVQSCSGKRSGEQRPGCWQLRWTERLLGVGECMSRERHCSVLEGFGAPTVSAVQVWTHHPFPAETVLFHCHTHSGGYIQSSAGLSQMGILTRNPQQEMAGTTQWHPWEAGALQHPAAHAAALWDHHRGCVFLAEKPAEQRSQRSSPSSRTSPGTVLQEVSLAEVVSVGGSRMSSGLFPSPVVIRTGSRGWDRERAGGI